MSKRDEFILEVKRTVAERAAYRCSNPSCRINTIGPHSRSEKSLSKGVAAHICAAAPDGPRFDSSQTQIQRTDISNAIWLCHNCSDLIDKDEQKYTKEILLKWKTEHEEFIEQGGGFPALPKIVLKTLNGLTSASVESSTITGNDVTRYREHVLSVDGLSNKRMPYFKCRIQFPEPIIKYRISNSPIGSIVKCEPDVTEWIGVATGSGHVSINPRNYHSNYKISVDMIPPRNQLIVHFLSIEMSDPFPFVEPPDIDMGIRYHILGEFQYQLYDEFQPRLFLVQMDWNSSERKITSLPCEERNHTKRIVILQEL